MSIIFVNLHNLQKIFTALILLLGFLLKKKVSPRKDQTTVDKVLNFKEEDRLTLTKKVINILG